MSDAKAAKLAAARKKLKDHQEKKTVHLMSATDIAANTSNNFEDRGNVSHNMQNVANLEIKDSNYSNDRIITNSQVLQTLNGGDAAEGSASLTVHESNQERQLHQQMQHHLNATEILVSEKRSLESKVQSLEELLKTFESKHTGTIEDLNLARQSLQKLEIELRDAKENLRSLHSELEFKSREVETYKLKEGRVLESKTELEEKFDATMTALTAKNAENSSLLSQLSQAQRELEITRLHLQQLTNGGGVSETDASVDPKKLVEQNKSLRHKNSRLEQQVKAVVSEKEQLAVHYQQYIQQLNEQIESSTARHRQQEMEKEQLADRESSLIDQISQMEIRIQALQNHISVLDKQEHPLVTNQSSEQLAELRLQFEANKAQLHLIDEEYRKVKEQLAESELKVIELTETVQTLQTEQPDVTKLSAANESDKVAAQRATAQNTKLKEELHGLQDAFVVMSNDKLELVEKLQAEKFLNRELTIKLSELEETLKDVQNKLIAKDEEMIRLQASCSKFEKELLLSSQEIDRLRHYEVTQSTDEVLRTELDFAEKTILRLKDEIVTLRNNDNNSTADGNSTNNVREHLTTVEKIDSQGKQSVEESTENILTDTNLNIIPPEEAMVKLQQRFLKTIKEVAELSDEKQNLEHIVLQLQGETETICEYIALYQQQRGILKQREEERAAQMKYLAAERERMQAQLEQLQRMVTGSVDTGPQLNSHFHQEKVDKIVNLLSEIKQSHLIDPNTQCSGLENFHPCPWCSGKLINV